MISYDFDYHKPTAIQEALELFQALKKQGKKPVYFSGGTEIITLGRVNELVTDAVIDIKAIPECNTYKQDNRLILGAALTLTNVLDLQSFPFLEKAVAEIADNTARNKITLGGNICANIIYREAVLPLLLTDSRILLASLDGLTEKPISELFHQELQLKDGELLVQVMTDLEAIQLPFYIVKKRRQWGVGYPLITVAALRKQNKVHVAISGLCSFPFRNKQMEDSLNNEQLSIDERIEAALKHIPATVLDDVHGSDAYRIFVLKNTLRDILRVLGGAENDG
ncbi:FAD binding domain-containing protein [Virgibacillus sp. 179-BFC.A HS]|uniref:FAD binding domain-containing protein n=1 Tax=Tigheibacillus jepli TaxID=3035914 RepID=A0ABU5CJP6_9BACI|nr:FAD binding domain-containing protein [Virgibacillus sp. 179-BFC.A HS]MDY0406151.1 FAD binding domain-containing protein [Virgibacillus sp. 179-BFC.A HS]